MSPDQAIVFFKEMNRYRRAVEEQIAQLKKTMEIIDCKCWYYEKAVEAGTLEVHKGLHEREDPFSDK